MITIFFITISCIIIITITFSFISITISFISITISFISITISYIIISLISTITISLITVIFISLIMSIGMIIRYSLSTSNSLIILNIITLLNPIFPNGIFPNSRNKILIFLIKIIKSIKIILNKYILIWG